MPQPSAEMFFATAEHDNQKLVALGVHSHFNNPDDPQFGTIVETWREYLEQEPVAPIAVTEGGAREPRFSDDPAVPDEVYALRLDGEMRLLSTLAGKANVPLITGEPMPAYSEIYDVLRQTGEAGVDPSVVFYYYFARNVPQWTRMEPQPSLDEFFDPNTNWGRNRLPRFSDLNADYSPSTINATHQRLYGEPFDPMKVVTYDIDASHPDMQCVADTIYEQRDRALGKTIVRLWNEGRSPFVLYHQGHLQSAPVHVELAALPFYTER